MLVLLYCLLVCRKANNNLTSEYLNISKSSQKMSHLVREVWLCTEIGVVPNFVPPSSSVSIPAPRL